MIILGAAAVNLCDSAFIRRKMQITVAISRFSYGALWWEIYGKSTHPPKSVHFVRCEP